jgi:hypothetical protein
MACWRSTCGRVSIGIAALLAGATAPAVACAAPRETASLRFTTPEPGASSGTEWRLDYRNPDDPHGKPPAVESTIAVFPAGTVLDTGAPDQCKASDAELMTQGADACPPGTKVGRGTLEVDTGSLAGVPRIIENDVTNFNNQGESVIFTQSTNMPGTQTRTVTRAQVRGTTITTAVPPIPGVPPPDPYTALKSFRLSVPPFSRGGRAYVRTPPTCPSSGMWTFTLTFVYRDGVRDVAHTTSPCVPRRLPRLRLRITPRRAVAGRRTRFHTLVHTSGNAPVADALVLLGGRRARTDAAGAAVISWRPRHRGVVRAYARLAGYRPAVRHIRVVSRHAHCSR